MFLRYTVAILLCGLVYHAAAQTSDDSEEVFIAVEYDAPDASSNVNATRRTGFTLTGFNGCELSQERESPSLPKGEWKRRIIAGFEDRIEMVGYHWQHFGRDWIRVYPNVDWSSAAAIDYFGPAHSVENFRADIQARLNVQSSMVLKEWWEIFPNRIHVRCDDIMKTCLSRCVPGDNPSTTEAYTLHGKYKKIINVEGHINFCPAYFRLPSLAQAMRDGPRRGTPDSLRDYWNRGAVWAHEIMHVKKFVDPIGAGGHMTDVSVTDDPSNKDKQPWKAYRTSDCKYLSLSPTLVDANSQSFNNPQNYAFFLLANYVQKELDYYPHMAIWLTDDNPPPRPANPQTFEEETLVEETTSQGRDCPLLLSDSSSSNTQPSETLPTSATTPTTSSLVVTTISQISEPSISSEPLTPLEQKAAVCHDEGDFPSHADIRGFAVINLANDACDNWKGSGDGAVGAGGGGYSISLKDSYGVDYDFSATWIDGCVTTMTSQSVYSPLGDADVSCAGMLIKSYSDCNNGGVGGYIDAGCVRYEFTGGER